MNGAHADMLDEVAVYVLGTLPEDESERVRRHIESCSDCRAEYEALLPVVGALARVAEAPAGAAIGSTDASSLLKARIMREVRPSKRNTALPAYLVAAACAVIALGFGWETLTLGKQLHNVQESYSSIARAHTNDESALADLVSARAKRYIVPGGEIVKSNNRIYIAMSHMPKPPAGKVYQAWTQPHGSKTMVPGLTFVPNDRGVAIVRVSSDASALHAVAVSIEPPGGSKAPTTSPVVVEVLD